MDVVVVGSCNTDLISYVPRLAKPGETIHGDVFKSGFGGKGANQCVMAARLGASVAMVAKVGNDVFGRSTIENFKENNVDVDHVHVTEKASTGVATILVDGNGQNSIVIVSGANMQLGREDVAKAEQLISCAKVLVCQLEIEKKVSLFALQMAKKYNIRTIFNVAPGTASLSKEYFECSDILCVNETEAALLLGLSDIADLEEVEKAVLALQRTCQGRVVLTLGENGVMFSEGQCSTVKHITVDRVTPMDTTGAGDAFVGAMSYYLSKHPSLPFTEVMKRSSQIATASVLSRGTQTSFPNRKDIPDELFQD